MDVGEGAQTVIMQTTFGAHCFQKKSCGCARAAAEWRHSADARQKHGKHDGGQDGPERGCRDEKDRTSAGDQGQAVHANAMMNPRPVSIWETSVAESGGFFGRNAEEKDAVRKLHHMNDAEQEQCLAARDIKKPTVANGDDVVADESMANVDDDCCTAGTAD